MIWILLSVLLLPGCTTIPSRFTQNESIYPNCGYVIEPLGDAGFALEIFLKRYSFSDPDPPLQAGKECFTKTAAFLAQQQGKKIAPITAADMSSNVSRTPFNDGNFSVYVTGRVSYAVIMPEPHYLFFGK